MLYTIQKEFNDDLVKEVSEKINEFKDSDSQKLTIYLNSPGGQINCKEALVSMINAEKEMIEIIAFGSIDSAAFLLFAEVECSKKVLKGTTAFLHDIIITIDINQKNKLYRKSERSIHIKRTNAVKKDFLETIQKIGLTNVELKKISKEGEIIFLYDRLNEMFNV
jgi:ATP-dependent protease ClpP protease subunit